jgi:hypothetical protein
MIHRTFCLLALAQVAALAAPQVAAQASQSEPASGGWRYGASLYGYLPTLSGTSSAPADSSGTPIDINAEKIVENLQFTLMGSLDAHNGRWGAFTDVVYLNFGGSKQQTRDFEIGGAGIPAGTTADIDWDLKGTVWTVAGQFRVVSNSAFTLDALAGARLLDIRTTTQWSIAGDLGPIVPAGRTGTSEAKSSLLDGIAGVKGRLWLGSSGRWFVPVYLDAGAGESDLTWQAATGISYAYGWGELTAVWRYLAYDMKPGESMKDLNFSGPLIGATFRW